MIIGWQWSDQTIVPHRFVMTEWGQVAFMATATPSGRNNVPVSDRLLQS